VRSGLLTRCGFSSCDLTGCGFRSGLFTSYGFRSDRLTRCRFGGGSLTRRCFAGGCFSSCDFSRCGFRSGRLSSCEFTSYGFRSDRLTRSRFSSCDLTGCGLSSGGLTCCSFSSGSFSSGSFSACFRSTDNDRSSRCGSNWHDHRRWCERVGNRRGTRVAASPVAIERAHYDPIDALADTYQLPWRHETTARHVSGQHLIQDPAKAIHIGTLIDLLARDLFRRGMTWHARHSEVHDLGDAIGRDEHVPRIEVAVKQSARMRGLKSARDLLGERPRFFFRQSAATLEQIVQGRSFDELAHEEWFLVGHAVSEHLHNVPVADAGRGLRLALEALDVFVVRREIGAQHAHHDLALKLAVECSVHVRSSATANALAQVETLGDLDHDVS
jgi:hypothetical protein